MANEQAVLKQIIEIMSKNGLINSKDAIEMMRNLYEPEIDKLTGEPPKAKRKLRDLEDGRTFRAAGREWVLLDTGTMAEPGADPYEDGTTEVALAIMKQAMLLNVEYDGKSKKKNYDESDMKKRIEADIQPKLERDYGRNIMNHTIGLMTVDGRDGDKSVECKVRTLTFAEARNYNKFLKYTGPDYWTITKWSQDTDRVMVVTAEGDMNTEKENLENAIRPVVIFRGEMEVETDVEE